MLNEINLELQKALHEINNADAKQLNIFARKLASIELRLQAARSLLESRLFDAEITLAEEAGVKIEVIE